MLGILLIFFIGNYFYKLAKKFNQNKWLFAILGIVIYYVGTLIGGFIFGLLDALVGLGIDWDNTLILSLIAIPFGIGAAVLFYYILNKKWSKSVVLVESEIQESENIGKDTDAL